METSDAIEMGVPGETEPVAAGLAGGTSDDVNEWAPTASRGDLLLPYSEEEAQNLSENLLEKIPDPYSTQGKTVKPSTFSLARATFSKAAQFFTVSESDDDDEDDFEYDEDKALQLHAISPLPGSRVSTTEQSASNPDSTLVAIDGSPTATKTAAVSGEDELNMHNFKWAPLLAHMELRKIARIRTGYSRTRNQVPLLIMLLIVVLLFVFLFYFASKYSEENVSISKDFDYEVWAWVLLGLVLVPGIFLMAVAVPRPIETAWFFIAGGFIFCLIGYLVYTVQLVDSVMGQGVCSDVDSPDCLDYIAWSSEAMVISTTVLGSVAFFFAVVSLISYLLRCFIYPALLHHYRNSPSFVERFLAVEPASAAGPRGTFSCKYRLPFPLTFSTTKHVFRFRGSTDSQGFAEGWGRVSDSAPSGELLEGWFEKGLPVPPFTSAEKGRFNAWEGLRVGFAGATGIDGFSHSGTWRDPLGLSWGVATVECSVAGRFFRNMPQGTIHVPRAVPSNPVEHMKGTILPALCAGIPGHYTDLAQREAIVYVHGLKQSLHSSAKKLAQLVSLASFPASRYSLWCFDWPGGSALSFNHTRKESGSAETEAELAQFLRILIDGGCKRVHLIGHSIGCRVVTNLARDGGAGFSKLFRSAAAGEDEEAVVETDSNSENKAELASVILINPEILLHDFILNRFAGTKKYCSSLTIYADRSDNALLLAELIGREATLGRNPHLVLTRDDQGKPRYLDVDIIDNTSLEQNINAIRHSYFALNSMLVQDVLEIIHLGLGRAKQRRRLRKRVGNVWSFLAAPSAAK